MSNGIFFLASPPRRILQDAGIRPKKSEQVEITVYSPDGTIIRPISHR
jgi:hypothetical protein